MTFSRTDNLKKKEKKNLLINPSSCHPLLKTYVQQWTFCVDPLSAIKAVVQLLYALYYWHFHFFFAFMLFMYIKLDLFTHTSLPSQRRRKSQKQHLKRKTFYLPPNTAFISYCQDSRGHYLFMG